MSTLYTDNIRANNASQITVPTGQKIVGTDAGSIVAPGHVVQVSHTKVADSTDTTTQYPTTVNLGSAVSFTPKFANSKLLVTTSGNLKMNNGADGVFVGLRRDGSFVDFGATQNAAMFIYESGTNQNHHQSCSSSVLINANAASATSFQFVFCRYGAAGLAQVGNWHGVHLTIQEIAQ